MQYTRFQDIPAFTRDGNYRATVPWVSLEKTLAGYDQDGMLDLDPDFQRAHVWNEAQQIRYVEFRLRRGKTGSDILFNAKGWNRGENHPIVLVDGKQRLQAVLRFLRNEIPAFGGFYNQYIDGLRMTDANFVFVINDLETRAEVLQWYIDHNAGGIAHTEEEINKVKILLENEKNKD